MSVEQKEAVVKDTDDWDRIKSLSLKGFTNSEISKILKINIDSVEDALKDVKKDDLAKSSQELYSDLQKELSKIILTEMSKTADKRDSKVMLEAIRLQAELQEKKFSVRRRNASEDPDRISKDVIFKRDVEMKELFDKGMSVDDIADKFNLQVTSVKFGIDRANLDLPDELKRKLAPSSINETQGLDKETRIMLLTECVNNDMPRDEFRKLCVKHKNESQWIKRNRTYDKKKKIKEMREMKGGLENYTND